MVPPPVSGGSSSGACGVTQDYVRYYALFAGLVLLWTGSLVLYVVYGD